jgi:hypothetical protein
LAVAQCNADLHEAHQNAGIKAFDSFVQITEFSPLENTMLSPLAPAV